MPRRFLTAEDVRRAGSREIRVEPQTVVTPQALEAAQTAGVRIVTAQGPWSPPTPQRGPDAERAEHNLSSLPEPSDTKELATRAIVTAVGCNKPGVLARITAAIAGLNCNVLDVSQKMVEGYFHMILTVDLGGQTTFGELKSTLENIGAPNEVVVRVMNERVFRFMHRV